MGETKFDRIKAKSITVDTLTVNGRSMTSVFEYKGSIDASANPNYPVAKKGDVYKISVKGKIGGASGRPVEAGDEIICNTDTAAGTEAAVGANWDSVEGNQTAAPASNIQSFLRTAAAPVTLLPAASVDRTVLITVKIDTVFANGDGAAPTFAFGQTGNATKFGSLNSGNAGETVTYSGTLSAGAALLMTPTAATGTTSTGAVTSTAIAIP
jgi:hypothetical protein